MDWVTDGIAIGSRRDAVDGEADLAEAFLTLMRRRPIIMPHPVILRSLVEHYQMTVSAERILAALAKERRLLLRPPTEGQL